MSLAAGRVDAREARDWGALRSQGAEGRAGRGVATPLIFLGEGLAQHLPALLRSTSVLRTPTARTPLPSMRETEPGLSLTASLTQLVEACRRSPSPPVGNTDARAHR